MSESFEIVASTRTYTLEISSGLYQHLLANEKDIICICDERFHPDFVKAGIAAIPLVSDESVKSLSAIPDVITALRKAGTTRDVRLLAVGGGIVQDVAAFCAAIYMRGLDWFYMPTTLLGMVDSCIGGKSSINVGQYKNLVGSYNPPSRVLIDPALAMTLAPEQIAAGLVEAAKISFCRGLDTWESYRRCEPGFDLDCDGFSRVIATSLGAKKWFIEIDEFDRKERLLLQLGHTFGHAVEGASGFRISHGVAVGVGMLCALALGRLRSVDYSKSPEVGTMRQHLCDLLAAVPDLVPIMQQISISDLFDRFKADKKHRTDRYRVVLVSEAGGVELVDLPKDDAASDQLRQAMSDAIAELQTNAAIPNEGFGALREAGARPH